MKKCAEKTPQEEEKWIEEEEKGVDEKGTCLCQDSCNPNQALKDEQQQIIVPLHVKG